MSQLVGHIMTDDRPKTLKGLIELIRQTPDMFTGCANANKARLVFLSNKDRKHCIAIVELETGMVEWPST